LGKLLDGSTRRPIHGNGYTVCNTNYGDDFSVLTGANYRLIADMNDSPAGLWAIDAAGQSGQPGNCHYGDQFPAWCSGQYHFLPLDPAATQQVVETTLILDPGRSSDDKIPDG
jgi:acyl-homoserine lactone acylase PvdQ